MEYKAINNSPYLVHFNPNHDKKNGRFTFKKAWDKIDTAVSKGYDAVEKVAKGAYRGIRKEFKDPSNADFNGYPAQRAPAKPETTAETPKNSNSENLDVDKANKDIAPGKKPPEAFKTPELDADYARVKSAKIPELQSKLPWLNDDDDANKIWGEQNVKAADIGLKALNKIGRQGYDEKVGITNSDRSWFVIEDQTIGMPSIAWLASKGKGATEITGIIDSNYRCQKANYEYEGQFNWLKNREEYEKYANDVPYKDLSWELSEYAGWNGYSNYIYFGKPDDFVQACVDIANESKVKHSVTVNCGNYLVHYNKNHSKANGQFTSGDGDGDGISDDHHNYKKNKWAIKGKLQYKDGTLTERGKYNLNAYKEYKEKEKKYQTEVNRILSKNKKLRNNYDPDFDSDDDLIIMAKELGINTSSLERSLNSFNGQDVKAIQTGSTMIKRMADIKI